MHSLVYLRQAPVQKVFLTATLAPIHEKVLAERVGISLARTLVLRSPAARPNHRIQIVYVGKPQTPFTTGVRLASLLLDTWDGHPDTRGIIFFRTIKNMEEFADSCPFTVCTFHGQMSDLQKDEQLNSWLSRKGPSTKWMLSTTALLHGVDYPLLNAVIFVGCPFGLYDFVQGAGRAGRSGQDALIVVLYSSIPHPLPSENQYGCRIEMEKLVTDKKCRRLGVSMVMDGESLPCSRVVGALLCDFCERRLHPIIEEAIKHPQQDTVSHNLINTPPATPTHLEPPPP